MAQDKVRIMTEAFARSVDRRKFLKNAGTGLFAGLMAFAAGHTTLGRAAASKGKGASIGGADADTMPWPPRCAPPGPYCSLTYPTPQRCYNGGSCRNGDASGCRGGSCFQHNSGAGVAQYRVVYNWYQAGCWTTAWNDVPNNTSGRWVCCDCGTSPNGGSPMCGCAHFEGTWEGKYIPPPPRPDSA